MANIVVIKPATQTKLGIISNPRNNTIDNGTGNPITSGTFSAQIIENMQRQNHKDQKDGRVDLRNHEITIVRVNHQTSNQNVFNKHPSPEGRKQPFGNQGFHFDQSRPAKAQKPRSTHKPTNDFHPGTDISL